MANNDEMNISQWVSEKRGRSLALSQFLGITQPVVSDWCTGKKAIAAEHCKAIERFTQGSVTCQEMRPTDWYKYWPELAQAPANTAQAAIEPVAESTSSETPPDEVMLAALVPPHEPAEASELFPARGEPRRRPDAPPLLPPFDDLDHRSGPGRREFNGGADKARGVA